MIWMFRKKRVLAEELRIAKIEISKHVTTIQQIHKKWLEERRTRETLAKVVVDLANTDLHWCLVIDNKHAAVCENARAILAKSREIDVRESAGVKSE